MYQLGSLLIFGQKLLSVYVGGCIKNVLLSISKNTNDCWEMVLPVSKIFTSTKSIFTSTNNSQGVTWKLCPRNFKNSEIDCTISQKENHCELQKLKMTMLLLYDYVKNHDSEDLKLLKMNDKNVSTS